MPRRLLLPAVAVAGALALAACGSSGSSSDGTTPASVPASTPSAASATKPTVSLPTSTPTSLVTTVITPGSGPTAEDGDVVVVNYVGVRSADGTEFDNSYDSAKPYTLTLGTGSVIAGWDQGLIGTQAGERLQLDIPADLAYGDEPQGDVIQAGDALSFVVDVVAVLPTTTATDAPQVTVTGAPNRDDLVTTDLATGTGPALQQGETAAIQFMAFRGDTGEQVFSSWEGGQPATFTYGVDEAMPGLVEGLDGMNVGGRRQVTVPFAKAFGESGNENIGMPGSTDLVLVIDLVAAY